MSVAVSSLGPPCSIHSPHLVVEDGAGPRLDRYVYFLRDPCRTSREAKIFFLRALGKEDNPHFFDSQKYVSDQELLPLDQA